MIDDGLFTRFKADAVVAMHNIPGMPAGRFVTRAGAMTASESLFEITIRARGGHAAMPHMGVDAIYVGAQLVTALQGIVSRNLNPARSGFVSVTELITDGRRNVLPGTAVLKGDARALSDDTKTVIEAAMRRICAGIASTHNVGIEVAYDTVFPALANHHEAASAAVAAARTIAGEDRVNPACEPKLFSEDFSHMARAVPACFMLIGNGTGGRPLGPFTPATMISTTRSLATARHGSPLLPNICWCRTRRPRRDPAPGSGHQHSDCHQSVRRPREPYRALRPTEHSPSSSLQ